MHSSSNTKAGEEKPLSGYLQVWRGWEICLLVISRSLLQTSLPGYLAEGPVCPQQSCMDSQTGNARRPQ
ncbi:hypothetical protein AV530_007354 [Patagioenas fasciata monilis]|uniref:Uncharacterized protein n=1 Tax=Patagioenas fasciata monilis TaxID=372326 RepID=A0A1V4JXS3_PATFA|nr:hypothetical protein AV530_007354 [Patagioenas fasciata monilis]